MQRSYILTVYVRYKLDTLYLTYLIDISSNTWILYIIHTLHSDLLLNHLPHYLLVTLVKGLNLLADYKLARNIGYNSRYIKES